GAMPPLIGWAAARGELTLQAWVLYAILFLWQFPHFLSIAWLYREDYARGGILMLPVVDASGLATGRQITGCSLALLPASLAPAFLGMAGTAYFWGALGLGLVFLHFSVRAAASHSTIHARNLLHASVAYLPLLFAFLMLDKR
nr:protoheme IX farnesyltransferase [Anaerolineae bacterium]